MDGQPAVRPEEASAFFERCPDGAALLGPGGRFLEVNPAACAMLRMTPDELKRTGLAGVVEEPDDGPLHRILSEGPAGRFRLDVTCRRGDGTTFVAAVNATPLGTSSCWMTVRDITARWRAEQALQSLDELTAELLGGAPLRQLMRSTAAAARRMVGGAAAWISATSSDGRRVVVVAQDGDSPDLPDYSGKDFPIESVLAGQIAMGDRSVLIDDLSHARSGASEMGRSLGLGPALGVPLRHRDRHFGSLIVAARPDRPRYGGEELATAEMLAGSAAVALALATVQGELAELAALYQESPDGVLLTGPAGELLSANRAAQAMFAMTEDELARSGRLPGARTAGAGPGVGYPGDERSEITYRRPDGTLLVGDVISVAANGAAGGGRRWTVVRDVTERRRTEEILRGLTDLTLALLRREPLEDILTLSAAHARRLVGGAAAYAATLSESGDEVMTVAEDSPRRYSLLGAGQPPGDTFLGRAITTGRSLVVKDLNETGAVLLPGTSPELGPALVVPLLHGERCFGALVVAGERSGPAYEEADLAVVEMFARSAALALDLSAARASLALVEERERIAKDLHDRVIQHLFGTGLRLQAVVGRPAEQMTAAINRSVEALDRIITEIRSTIVDLTGG